MASVVDQPQKRPHVKTERMQEFLKTQAENGSPVRLLKCPEEGCNKVLTSSPGLRYHLKSHYQDRPYSCHKCHKTFKSANGLKYHLEKTKCDGSSFGSPVRSYPDSSTSSPQRNQIHVQPTSHNPAASVFSGTNTSKGFIKVIPLNKSQNLHGSPQKSPTSTTMYLKYRSSLPTSVSQLRQRIIAQGGGGPMGARRCLTPTLECFEGAESFPSDDEDNMAVPLRQHGSAPPPVSSSYEYRKPFLSHSIHNILSSSGDRGPSDLNTGSRTDQCSSTLSSPDTQSQHYRYSCVQNSQNSDTEPVSPFANRDAGLNRLTELAIIATGPQSPLIRRTPPPTRLRPEELRAPENAETESTPYSLASPVKTSTATTPKHESVSSDESDYDDGFETPPGSPYYDDMKFDFESDQRVTSSSPFPADPKECKASSETWSHSWPTAVWQCFIKGSRVRFMSGSKMDWQLAEDLASRDQLTQQACQSHKQWEKKCYAPNGLRLLHVEQCRCLESQEMVLRLRFSPDKIDQPEILVQCPLDHPFFVKDKGWSSFHPSLTAEHYGIPCCELEDHDVCLPPTHPDATFNLDVFESFKSFDFTPMDSSAVFTLSNMAKQKRDLEVTSPKASPTRCPRAKSDSGKAKRPMNAFMLFAKKFRLEYTQMFPGKDNRAISVLLGDKWKKMRTDERKVFSQEAKHLAEQHRKLNPDCWKRKRSMSGSTE
ncbi:HMG box-containing protein 1-like isoform X2 [Lineus longissimus]|uniref:HMG box-containing protein 1-like isoform X2 n=1 Tax=Lineus longissimus TaxID=88925 RepID=UPI002B4CE8DA